MRHAQLVGNRDQAGEHVCRHAHAVKCFPWVGQPEVVGIANGVPGSVHGHIGNVSFAGGLNAILVAWLDFVGRLSARAAGRLAGVAVAVDREHGVPDGHHVRGNRGIEHAPIRRHDERHRAVAGRGGEDAIGRGFRAPFVNVNRVCHHDRYTRVACTGVHCRFPVGETGSSLQENDVRFRRDGMHPLHVNRLVASPAGVGGRIVRAARLVQFQEGGRVRQAELLVEDMQVARAECRVAAAHQVRIVVDADNGDRLSRPVAGQRSQLDLVDPVGTAGLRRRQSGRT